LRTIRLQQRGHSFRYSVFIQLQSWLCVGMFCKRAIFCVNYMRTHILMSLITVPMKVWTVTVTSPQLLHITNCIFYWSTDPTISTLIFHHIYQDNFYNGVRLAQTLLDRNVRVCSTMRANRGIPRDLEGEGKRLKKEKSAFQRNGEVMVRVWNNDNLCE
jgi:hypothetical protein